MRSGKSEDSAPEADIGDADMQALAARARAADGPEREAYRKAGEAHRLRPRQPVRADRSGAGRLRRRRRRRLRPDRAAHPRGDRQDRRRPAFDAISFDTEPDELPLIREGCAMRALTFVDQEIFAPGVGQTESAGKEVA